MEGDVGYRISLTSPMDVGGVIGGMTFLLGVWEPRREIPVGFAAKRLGASAQLHRPRG